MKPLRPPANESKEAVALRVAASAWAVAAHYLLPEIQGEALNRRLLAAAEAYARKAAAARGGDSALERFCEAETVLWEAVVAFAAHFMRAGDSDEIVGEALKRRVLAAVESFALQRKAAAARNGRKGGRAVRGGGS